jgi:BirA family transcriptional regulator, biotin operon repressor / biotin---[acetyl-CoA-carboxylase] ligase
MKLDPTAHEAGVELIALDEVDSTNTQALRYGETGMRGPLWVTAQIQTAGRGRRGRVWISEPGNLYASLLLADPAPLAHVTQCSFVAAVAVREAVCDAAPGLADRLSLKWPNDVLCDGRKLAGVLIEGEGANPLMVAIGIGINCRHHPSDAVYPATNLGAEGADVTAAAVFTALTRRMAQRLALWNAGTRFADIRAAWLAHGPRPGAALRVRLAEGDVTGSFDTIDEHGSLVLIEAGGARRRITAGDVFPLAAPDEAAELATPRRSR